MEGTFHANLKILINELVLLGYTISEKFPRQEIYGMTGQARRALLSVMLNYIEGFGRIKRGTTLQFYETSFASLKESIYVFYLAMRLNYINVSEYKQIFIIKERVAQMLWKTMEGIRKNKQKTD